MKSLSVECPWIGGSGIIADKILFLNLKGKYPKKLSPNCSQSTPQVKRRSAAIFRFQPHVAVNIPTSESINNPASVTSGDFCDGIMIGE